MTSTNLSNHTPLGPPPAVESPTEPRTTYLLAQGYATDWGTERGMGTLGLPDPCGWIDVMYGADKALLNVLEATTQVQ